MLNKGKTIHIMSFGYKYGLPAEVNFVQDVRFLPNPFYIDGLKNKTGICTEVQDYVKDSPVTAEYLSRLKEFILSYARLYLSGDKDSLVIAVGCTGGRHRSVTVAEEIYGYFKDLGYNVSVSHRDMEKGDN